MRRDSGVREGDRRGRVVLKLRMGRAWDVRRWFLVVVGWWMKWLEVARDWWVVMVGSRRQS